MSYRRYSLAAISISAAIIFLLVSGLYSVEIAFAEDPVIPSPSSTNIPPSPVIPLATPTFFHTPTPAISQIVTVTPNVMGTISALQVALTESATNGEDDRINIQSTLSSLEVSASEIVRQQESLLRMQIIGFCVIGIIILGVIVYSMGASKRITSIRKQLRQTHKQPASSSQDSNRESINKNTQELVHRLETAEQEARIAKKVSQEAYSQLKDLEAKLAEQSKMIASLKAIEKLSKQGARDQGTYQNVSTPVIQKDGSTDVRDTLVVNILRVYNQLVSQIGEKFVPLDKFVFTAIQARLGQNEAEVYKILEYIAQKYPGAISIETIRGKIGKHIAVFKEYL